MFAPLYDEKTIEKKFSDIQVTNKQRKLAKEWLEKLRNKELEKEKENYFIFRDVILKELLGYPEEEIIYEEKRVEFSVKDENGKTAVCFEAKGTKTKDLFARQNYGKSEQEHPVLQTMSNMDRFPASYGVCTNYRNFVLLDREQGITKCHRFDFYDVENNERKLKEFIGIFSYQNLVIKKSLVNLYKSSVTAEKEFTKEFYKLFHETRLMMKKAFEKNEDVTREDAVHYAQIFLNRLVFIFFAEDRGDIEERLLTKRILKILEGGQCTEFSKSVSDEIVTLFKVLDKGSNILGIFGFNGGLFEKTIPPKINFLDLQDVDFFRDVLQHSKFSRMMKLDEFSARILYKYRGKLNPIIHNILLMDSFDFNTAINVNIMGHIFEQSISDLEELTGKKSSRRKKQGVYYTPEYITEYICNNTIIPYLSKKGATSVNDLISEYSDNIDELEKRVREIKILDPACGSGAFLIKAVEILLNIDQQIQQIKSPLSWDQPLEEWSKEKEIIKIIENNVFGVDINEESVEITKLSLFLKMATVNRKLLDLSESIKVGNSLVNDKSVDTNAFDWEEKFKEIFDAGGFDVIIGNPPYLKIEHLGEHERQYFQEHYSKTFMKRYDAYGLFIEKSISLLKDGGLFGMIMPSTILNNITFTKLRKLILDSTTIPQIVNLGGKIFENVNNDTLILLLTKNETQSFPTEIYDVPKYGGGLATAQKTGTIDLPKVVRPPTYSFELRVTQDVSNILAKMEINSIQLGEICSTFQGFVSGNNEAYLVTSKEIDSEKLERIICKPSVFGDEVRRYGYPKPSYYVIYLTRNDQISDFPRVKKRLEPFKNILEKKREVKLGRQPWYSLHWPRDSANFERKEKLLVQAIRNLALKRRIVATIDYDGLYADHTINVIILDNHAYDLRYVLGILNSNLINYLFQNKYVDINIKAVYLDAIPIRKIDHDDQNKVFVKKFIEKVNFILKYNNEFYSKHEKFLHRAANTFGIGKISTKLENFYTVSFESFLAEIKQSSKISLKDQDEWEDYFEHSKLELLNLKKQIDNTEREVNQMVYELYRLGPNEISIIEDSASS